MRLIKIGGLVLLGLGLVSVLLSLVVRQLCGGGLAAVAQIRSLASFHRRRGRSADPASLDLVEPADHGPAAAHRDRRAGG